MIWDAWQNKPLDEVITLCRDLVEDTEFPTVKKWKARGGKVLGHFQVYFPEEIADAAGMLPVKLRGSQIERFDHTGQAELAQFGEQRMGQHSSASSPSKNSVAGRAKVCF